MRSSTRHFGFRVVSAAEAASELAKHADHSHRGSPTAQLALQDAVREAAIGEQREGAHE